MSINPLFLSGMLALAAMLPLLSTRVSMKIGNFRKRFTAAKTNQSGWIDGEIVLSIIILLPILACVIMLFSTMIRGSSGTLFSEVKSKDEVSKASNLYSDSSASPSEFIAQNQTQEPVKEIAPYDPSILLTVLSVIGVVVLLAVIAYVGTLVWNRQIKIVRIAKSDTEHISGIIEEASKKISDTLLASASYETDLAKQIEYPLMTDITQTKVVEYIKNMKRATFARDSLSKTPTLEIANDYFAIANNFETSFKVAETWAVSQKWSTFSVAEHRRLNDARVSLALLEDHTTSPDQRNALYRRLEKLLAGLVIITDKVKKELSNKVPMLALESAK